VSCEVLELDVFTIIWAAVPAGIIPAAVEEQSSGGSHDGAGTKEDDAAQPGRGIAVADGPRLLGGVPDVLAADGIDGGIEGIQQEDDDQQGHADDGDRAARDECGPGIPGGPPAAPVVRIGKPLARAIFPAVLFHAIKTIGRPGRTGP
jgi:hypothetical protein